MVMSELFRVLPKEEVIMIKQGELFSLTVDVDNIPMSIMDCSIKTITTGVVNNGPDFFNTVIVVNLCE